MLETLLTILAWLGFAAAIGGFLCLAFLCVRQELPDEPVGDDAHGDWPAIPDDLKRTSHSKLISTEAQRHHG